MVMTSRPQSPPDYCSPAERIIHSVAEQTNTDPLELPLLYKTIDTDALDAFLTKAETGEIQFQYAGQTVSVESGGEVHLSVDGVTHAPQTD